MAVIRLELDAPTKDVFGNYCRANVQVQCVSSCLRKRRWSMALHRLPESLKLHPVADLRGGGGGGPELF